MSDSNSKSPKSQSQQQRHKNLYKTSPNWQQIYKKQCLSRLNDKRNESRSRLIDRFRNIELNDTTNDNQLDTNTIVDEVMKSVWDQFNSHLPPIDNSDITEFMEQIRQELLIEESLYWEQIIEWRNKEELDWLINNSPN